MAKGDPFSGGPRPACSRSSEHGLPIGSGMVGAALFYGDARRHACDLRALGRRRSQARDACLGRPTWSAQRVFILIGAFHRSAPRHREGGRLLRSPDGSLVPGRMAVARPGAHLGRSGACSWRDQPHLRGLSFLVQHGRAAAFAASGRVFFSVTGAEALYADIGHSALADPDWPG